MDKTYFKTLFEQHYSPLCNFAYRIIGDLDKSEDIVQDVFVKIWNEKNLLDAKMNVNSFIYTMVKNRALEVARRENTGLKITRHLEYLQKDDFSEQVDDVEIEKLKLLEQIYVSIRQLPPKCADVFILSKVNGLTYAQIADRMNISVKTVENQMGKALKKLRESLSHTKK